MSQSQSANERSRLLPAIPHRSYVYADELVMSEQRTDELISFYHFTMSLQSPILEPAMTTYAVTNEGQATRRWTQYVAALAATGGALAAGE